MNESILKINVCLNSYYSNDDADNLKNRTFLLEEEVFRKKIYNEKKKHVIYSKSPYTEETTLRLTKI